jgi:aubergine-like protein
LDQKADWGNDMKGLPLLTTINIQRWIVIYPQSKEASGRKFVQTYGEVMVGMGINSLEPVEYLVRNDDPMTITQMLKEKIKSDTQMVVVIVSSKRKDRYDAIKKICCLELPIPSQVVTSAIIDDPKKSRSVVTKVAIQMNCKLGGEVWMSNIPIKNLMICGIDTYHDSVRKNASVCAFVATTNTTHTKYFSRATIQETHQELSANLELTFRCI